MLSIFFIAPSARWAQLIFQPGSSWQKRSFCLSWKTAEVHPSVTGTVSTLTFKARKDVWLFFLIFVSTRPLRLLSR